MGLVYIAPLGLQEVVRGYTNENTSLFLGIREVRVQVQTKNPHQ